MKHVWTGPWFWLALLLIVSLESSDLAAAKQREIEVTAGSMFRSCKSAMLLYEDKLDERHISSWHSFYIGKCLGFVYGFRSGSVAKQTDMMIATDVDNVKPMLGGDSACIPGGVSNGEMVRVLMSFLEKHPKRFGEDAGLVAGIAFSKAWPCNN